MSNVDSVSQFTPDSFSYVRIGVARGVTLNTTGNGAVTNIAVPILSGGLTNGGGVANSGSVIVRRVTVQNPSGSISTANIALGSVTGAGTFQDLSVVSSNSVISGANTQALYVTVTTASGNGNTCDITVWGDVVSF